MIDDETKKRIYALCNKPVGLGGWLGRPYEDEGCLKFAIKFYAEMGIELTKDALRDRRNFEEVKEPRFGDIAVFHGVQFAGGGFHVGVMLDYRKCIQCLPQTNGVGKIDISRPVWDSSLKGFYRHKDLCS
jgi:NlpC/P60 family.